MKTAAMWKEERRLAEQTVKGLLTRIRAEEAVRMDKEFEVLQLNKKLEKAEGELSDLRFRLATMSRLEQHQHAQLADRKKGIW